MRLIKSSRIVVLLVSIGCVLLGVHTVLLLQPYSELLHLEKIVVAISALAFLVVGFTMRFSSELR